MVDAVNKEEPKKADLNWEPPPKQFDLPSPPVVKEVEGVEMVLKSEDGDVISQSIRGIDVAIKWCLVVGLLMLILGLILLTIGVFGSRQIGLRIGISWLSLKVVDSVANQTVLTGTYRLRKPIVVDIGNNEKQMQQPLDLGSITVPSNSPSNLRLLVTEHEFLEGSDSSYAQWNGANEKPGIAPTGQTFLIQITAKSSTSSRSPADNNEQASVFIPVAFNINH